MPHRSPIRRIGRRGLILIICGLNWTLYGTAYLQYPIARFTRDESDPNVGNQILVWFDGHWVGFIWIVCGLIAVIFGCLRSRLAMMSWDHYGFNAILFPSIVWALLFFWSWIVNLLTGGMLGVSSALLGFLVWVLVTGFILIIAGWPDPSDLPPAYYAKVGESR